MSASGEAWDRRFFSFEIFGGVCDSVTTLPSANEETTVFPAGSSECGVSQTFDLILKVDERIDFVTHIGSANRCTGRKIGIVLHDNWSRS